MKEAMVICPQRDNDGHGLGHVKHYAVLSMCKAFGGCTVSSAQGTWEAPDGTLVTEPVWQLVSAYDEADKANDAKLTSVALYIGHEGKQQAVYTRYASGEVAILDTYTAQQKAA